MKTKVALRSLFLSAAALSLAACASTRTMEPISATATPLPAAAEPAPLAELIDAVDIPYETFTLDNGLTTIVHTDRKAPIVGVTVYYRVGSKNEPRGRTGFAHLFEHLMFGGSENVDNFDKPLVNAGSTPTNGSTYYDRTNYVETVPTGALDLALMMESDRMGHLLGAVTQEGLDNQRSVVQNEKRQGDNQPYGLTRYAIAEGLLPVGHPYRHSTIGSMADLDAASLADVRSWFADNYGPNNVVLALAGDIDVATAREKVQRWFGDIPRGPDVEQYEADPVTLAAPVTQVMTDQVPQTVIYQAWTGPGMTHPDATALQVGMYILGGLASSRLDNELVRGEEVATSVSAYSNQQEQISFLQSQVSVKPDGDVAEARALLERETARLLAEGPTQDELDRATTQIASGTIGSLERVGGFGGKGMILAEGLLYTGDADYYREELERMAALTPADVQAAMRRWLGRPAFTLVVEPGERTLDGGTMGGWGDEASVASPQPDAGGPAQATAAPRDGPERPLPDVAPVGDLTFPAVQTATLSNGIEVRLARREAIPKVSVAMTFDAGSVVDPADRAGTHETMVDLLTEGTTSRSALDIATQQEKLGASINTSAGTEVTTAYVTALTENLVPSLELFADVVRNPSFAPDAVARVKSQRASEIANQLTSPGGLASRAFGQLVYGESHPYAHAMTAGDADVVASLTPADMAAEHDEWIRPDLAAITVVGDVSMDDLLPALERTFGDWQAPATPAPARDIDRVTPAPRPRLVVVDRPNSPSSYLMLGRLTPLKGYEPGMERIDLANEVIGSGFLSRLMQDLRETKGWTYGIGSGIATLQGQRFFRVQTQVQADRTADSIRAILDQMRAFPSARPVTAEEVRRVTDGNVRGLPNEFETNGQVLGALLQNRLLGRDDRYQARLPQIYRGIDAAQIDAAAREYLSPENFTIVVVGDRDTIEPQLETLDMPITWLSPDDL
ncbi:M16 family metallopeptidase [Aurantiacibacter spongiae]|nr:pitrilysin family protein [Aurantiacibacter spongiae]